MKIPNLAFVLLIIILAEIISAQEPPQMRSITSDDFNAKRPLAKQSNSPKVKPVHYKFIRVDHKNSRLIASRRSKIPIKPPSLPNKSNKVANKVVDIGVTMWKMRPPRSTEMEFALLPVNINGTQQKWIAERVDPDSFFDSGDLVRFAIESKEHGYLYIIDREMYSDGSYGPPCLIFPEPTTIDNSIYPGMLFDLPDQRETPPHFTLKSHPDCTGKPRPLGGPNFIGDLMTVIISSTRLSSLKTDSDARILDIDALVEIEDSSEIEVFSRKDNVDQFYSKAESDSACGGTLRGIVREKSTGGPCGATPRQLTRDDISPHSIYRAKVPKGKPAAIFIQLKVRN